MFRVFAFYSKRFTYTTPVVLAGLLQMTSTLQRLGD